MLHELHFPSSNNRDQVTGWIYVPACEPEGIVQLVHGFGEHSRRYFHMIVAFMDAGYIVAADDHVGHGATAIANGTWGDWGDAGPHTMMEDEKRFKDLVCAKYPGLPYFMFGHSMGSMIARDFSAKYGDELAGAIYCGTTGIFKNTREVRAKLDEAIAAGKAHESDPSFVSELMGWMFARCDEGAALGNEWICHDPYVQKDHAADPFDAFAHPVHNVSLRDFIDMMLCIEGPEWAQGPRRPARPAHCGRPGPRGQLRRGCVPVRELAHRHGARERRHPPLLGVSPRDPQLRRHQGRRGADRDRVDGPAGVGCGSAARRGDAIARGDLRNRAPDLR